MGKTVGLAIITVFAASQVVYAGLFDSGKPPSAADQSVSAPKKAAPSPELLAKKAADFNDTEWIVKITPMDGKGQAAQDTLTFIEGKVVSQNMQKQGYNTTNFSTRLLEDGATFSWETMQTSDKDGIMSWRGDIGSDGVMHGVISKHDKKNNGSDFTLVSVGSQKITPPAPASAAAQPAPAPAQAPASAAPAND